MSHLALGLIYRVKLPLDIVGVLMCKRNQLIFDIKHKFMNCLKVLFCILVI